MNKHYTAPQFGKALVPITPGCDVATLLAAGRLIVGGGEIMLIGLVGVAPLNSLSTGTLPARELRQILHEVADEDQLKFRKRVRVSHEPWEELIDVVDEEQPDILILEWPTHFDDLQIVPVEAFTHPPCDLIMVRGPIPEQPQDILVALRSSPYAEFALRITLSIARASGATPSAVHFRPSRTAQWRETSFVGLGKVLDNLPEVEHQVLPADDPAEAIIEYSKDFDLVVLGATARPVHRTTPIGPVADRMLRECPPGVIVARSVHPPSLDDEVMGSRAISILVDKWFAENTFHADEFSDLEYLYEIKKNQEVTISLALPALNEQETVGNVIHTVKNELMENVPLLDEIVLIDSNSTDQTRAIARKEGVPVYIHQEILPEYAARRGKGEALWKSLYVTKGDIIVWVDTDIVNIHPRFVYGLLGPLLVNPGIDFIKGFYRRPLKVGEKMQAGGGGRVTELTARPMLNLFFPELSGVVQPLSGEYGGRRSALEQLTFYSGYGVETGLLIDMLEKFGLSSIAQVDLRERIHHNQALESLSKMSFAIIQVVCRKLEKRYGQGILEDVNRSMKLIRYEPGRLFLDVEEIAERERPPMVELPEYLERHQQ
jgi:glycosyltransferase involved in cell wall biosynthesis/nucleotide-binding universal stress UspA family protein